jgi:hypothetical protein
MGASRGMSISARLFDAFSSQPRPPGPAILRSTVGEHADRLVHLLSSRASDELSAQDIRAEVEGNLWMLTPDAFRYFLPAFLRATLDSYSTVSIFASELVSALTKPSREDVADAVARAGESLPEAIADEARKQQLEWFDSGTPATLFHERFDTLTPGEGSAVLEFLSAFRQAHGADFPLNELETAIERHWSRYAPS